MGLPWPAQPCWYSAGRPCIWPASIASRGPHAKGTRVTAEFARRADPAADVEIVLHPIPTPDAKPYITVVGPDGRLWFCESGTGKIGRLDLDDGTFSEFPTPTANSRPIGIIPGPDGNLWFCENAANQIGRITPHGLIT